MVPRASSRHLIALVFLLAGCGRLPSGVAPPGGAGATATACYVLTPPAWPTVPPGGIVLQDGTTLPWPTLMPQPLYTHTALRYQIIQEVGSVVYCDPDQWPLPRNDEPQRAQAWFKYANPEVLQAIARHAGLGDPRTFTPDQQLGAYREFKALSLIALEVCGDGYAFQYVAASPGQGMEGGQTKPGERVTGKVDAAGKISVLSRVSEAVICPICLARGTRIATPGGEVPVQALRVGDDVWTLNAAGERVPGVVLRVAQVPVPATHLMVALQLADGRALLASPGHPTTDGRRVGQLRPGDTVGGVTVLSADLVPYDAGATYDILPSGPTGAYWANGVLLGSTLGP